MSYAAISQSFINTLVERVNIVDVIDSYISLKKTGRNFTALCPFHAEKTPSFNVNPDKNFYYCFGCNAHGTAISFLMNYAHLEFSEAVHELASRAGMQVEYEKGNKPPTFSNQDKDLEDLYDIMAEAAHYYQQQLRQSHAKIAVDYLKKRGITGEIARNFGLGYAPQGWDNLLKNLGTNAKRRELLLKTGLIKEFEEGESNKLYDRFRHRVMFPILNHRGKIVAFGGRLLEENAKEAKYLNSPETPLFQKNHILYEWYRVKKIPSIQEVIIVEGYMDVLALAQYGIVNAVAVLGSAVNENHLNTLFRNVSKIIFCFDGDDAGRKAAWRALEITLPLLKGSAEILFAFLPQGDDPDTFVRREGATGFKKYLSQALSLSQFFFQHLEKQVNMNTIDGRSRLASLALPLINTVSSRIYRDLMEQELSKKTSLDVKIFQQGSSVTSVQNEQKKIQKKPFQKKSICKSLICNIVALFLQNPQYLFQKITYPEKILALKDSDIEDIALFIEILVLIQDNPNMNTSGILENLRGTAFEDIFYQLVVKQQFKPLEIIEEDFSSSLEDLYKEYDMYQESVQLRQDIWEQKSGA